MLLRRFNVIINHGVVRAGKNAAGGIKFRREQRVTIVKE